MQLLYPFPGEILGGYCSRVKAWNLFGNREFAQRLGCELQRAPPLNYIPIIEGVFKALYLDRRIGICRYTLVPIIRCVASYDREVVAMPTFGDIEYLKYANWAGAHARLCPECVALDLRTVGIAFWRRSHQILGVDWCTQHLRPLMVFSGYGRPFNKNPEDAMRLARELPRRPIEAAMRSRVVSRFAELANLSLELLEKPAHAACFAYQIRRRAAAQGLRVIPGKSGPYLSDAVCDSVPRQWLLNHFPRSVSKRRHQFAPWIDATGHARSKPSSSLTFILSLAVLSDTAQEAIVTLQTASPDHVSTTPRQKARAFDSKEAAVRAWLRHRGRAGSIAKEVGRSCSYVQDLLHSYGFPRSLDFRREFAALDRRVAGQTRAEALAATGATPAAFDWLIKQYKKHGQGCTSVQQVC